MQIRIQRSVFYVMSLLACTIMTVTAGCASGGFKLTRQYAGFVNKQDLIIRIILYILTGVVFAVTLLIDVVIFNTVDFWEGRVSQGDYEFNKDGKTFLVRHEIIPGNSRKKSTIQILGKDKEKLQEVVLLETVNDEIEMSVDGKIRAKVRDISSLPVAAVYDEKGGFIKDAFILFEMPVTSPLLIAGLARR